MRGFWVPRTRVTQFRTGILIVNLGSPDTPAPRAVRRYLRQFLTDPRVIDAPRLPWSLLLNLIILPIRSRRSAARYARIWTSEGSPLIAITSRLAVALEEAITARTGQPVPVTIGMRYGHPSVAEGLRTLAEAGSRRILILPLFPQYSAATVGSITDAAAQELRRWRNVPAIRTIAGYAADPRYIAALTSSIREHWHTHGRAERLCLSFHGLPQRYADAGDPYPTECTTTASALAQELGLTHDAWAMTYQSRFGRGRWLEPSTAPTLERWAREGLRSVDVVCPGFATDCLETLGEIAVENHAIFEAAGGSSFRYIPALNDRPVHVQALASIAIDTLAGWL